MPVPCAIAITLTASQPHLLKRRARGQRTPWRDRVRAQIVRRAACGHSNARIARDLQITPDTVRTWRGRFAARGLAGLLDLPRSGRPARITPLQKAEVKALACQLPAETGVPISRWSCPELTREILTRGLAGPISVSTVRRILAEDPIKPWQYQSWIFVRDPDFPVKAARVLELYQRHCGGRALGAEEYVICADAKTSIQARCRCHPSMPPGASRMMRVEHEYTRGGALAYLAALDVHAGTVAGHCAPVTGIAPFMTLVAKVMSTEPYASAKRVFWVVDNGSDHRGQAAIDRLAAAYPNCVMIHTPVHASWLNQVEIFNSIIQRKVVTPNDFSDLAQLEARLLAFQERYNATAAPFNWRFTAGDLDKLLARLDTPKPQVATPSTMLAAA